MSPLNILPKTHLGGADPYPHNLIKKKIKLFIKPMPIKKLLLKIKF